MSDTVPTWITGHTLLVCQNRRDLNAYKAHLLPR